jgi:Peptidase family M50
MEDDSLLIPAAGVLGIIVACILWPFLSIFLHELGHVLAAKLVGLRSTHLIVGHPDWADPIVSRRVFGVKVEWWPIPFGGMTLLETPPTNKLKAFIVTLGGPIFDTLIILTAFQLLPHARSFLKIILAIIILSEAENLIYNLIPASLVYEGVRVPRDGKVLLQILLGRPPREI